MRILIWSTLAGLSFWVQTAITNAEISELNSLTGDNFEDFTSLLGTPVHVDSVDVFDGDVTLNIVGDEGSIFVAGGSSLGGDLVTAYTAPLAISQLGIMEWKFHRPINRIGGYFENSSRFDDATFEFYGADNELIGTGLADVSEDGQQWVWNGWESTIPIHRIISRGHDVEFLSGFIWYDNLEISYAPVLGDINLDGEVDLTDVQPFVDRLTSGVYQPEADINSDGIIDLLDVQPFVSLLAP